MNVSLAVYFLNNEITQTEIMGLYNTCSSAKCTVHIFVCQCTKSYVSPKGMNGIEKLALNPKTGPVSQIYC